ncbi:hypothetical protein BDY24DRAFT_437712 [Mrakia frigida]|uniref:uncharacterized protein n=1 Tax=Mrakia frigida TaxID=29902 RepID=UPI003FCC1B79
MAQASCEPVTPIGRVIKTNRMYYLALIQLATNLDNALFGVLGVAVWTYFTTFKHDRRFIKALVASLLALNIAQTVSAIAFTIQTFVVYTGNWDIFSLSYVIAIQTVESLAVFPSQLFFLGRVYKLSKSPILVAFLLPLIVADVGLGLSNAPGSSSPDDVDFAAIQKLSKVNITWKAVTFAIDFFLTSFDPSSRFVYFLQHCRNGWRKTDKIVSSLIYFTMEAQILPLTAALYFLVAYVQDAGGNVWFLGSFAEAKVAALRAHIRRDLDGTEPTELPSLPRRTTYVTPDFPSAETGKGAIVVGTGTRVQVSEPSPSDRLEWETSKERCKSWRDEQKPEQERGAIPEKWEP